MDELRTYEFSAPIAIIGINPFVFVPQEILLAIFEQAGKDKGVIRICGEINGRAYQQSLVRYKGDWRLYINTFMLKNSPKRIGEVVNMTIRFDTADRSILPHPKLLKALENNKSAKIKFDSLRPALRHEIVRYIAHLKTEESIDRNIEKAILFLLGKGRFVGREL